MSQQAQELSQALQKIMRSFGRQCRGQGKVFVKLVRETERHLLALGNPIETWSQYARECLHHDNGRSTAQRERLLRDGLTIDRLVFDALVKLRGRNGSPAK